jgi:Right handed beta helix region
MLRLALVVVPLLALAGCQKENAAFCPDHPGMQGCPDATGNGGPCKSNDNCTDKANFPICDTTDNGGTCVLCTATDHAACSGVTPACPNHACVACASDNDCGTDGLCLPTGACVASANIIHVSATGVPAGSCGAKNQPCSLANALGAVDSVRNVIKIEGGGTHITTGAANFIVVTNVTIDARGATLTKNVDNSPILTINDSITATIFGGNITGAKGPTSNGDGIKCGTNSTLVIYDAIIQSNDALGIDANGCSLVTLSRTQILTNKRGGIKGVTGKFVIVGNVFVNNGDGQNPNKTVEIATGPDPMNRLEFNTIANNTALNGVNAGLDCTVGTSFTAHDNIIWNNTGGIQISGICLHSYSDIGPLAIPVPGTGNKKDDPLLGGIGMWHLGTGSPAIGGADPQADLSGIAAKDIDGDMRVKAANMGADIGADQVSK